ncbi:lysophospholipase [Moorella thermoacetica Y72]|uniref:Lysophospholipase n=1 Tax=Moorella thermoacetica Y72 TaxID=1325331 RepID=A0A0S6UEH2_NEOTH|nr:lysophospholipase [Moorella thermoacetica Y72]
MAGVDNGQAHGLGRAGFMILEVAGDQDFRPRIPGGGHNIAAGAAADGHPFDLTLPVAHQVDPTRPQRLLHPQGEFLQGDGLGQHAGAADALGRSFVGQGVHVIGHFLVGVGFQQGPQDLRQPAGGDDGLQAVLFDLRQFALFTGIGTGAGQGHEGAGTGHPEGAVGVVADPAGSGPGEGFANDLFVVFGDEGDELVILLPVGGDQDPDVLQLQPGGQVVADPQVGAIQIGVGRVDHDVILEEAPHQFSHGLVKAQVLHRPEEEGVVADNQVNGPGGSLGGYRRGYVQAYQDASDLRLRRAEHEADVVPAGSQFRRGQGFHNGYDLAALCSHVLTSPNWSSRRCNSSRRSRAAALWLRPSSRTAAVSFSILSAI